MIEALSDVGVLEIKSLLRKNIRGRRMMLKLTQQALADSMGCARSTISVLERGGGSIAAELLPMLAGVLETTVVELFIAERFYREDVD